MFLLSYNSFTVHVLDGTKTTEQIQIISTASLVTIRK